MAEYLPARTIEAMVKGVYWAPRDTFVSEPLDVLGLTYDGIPGDRHAGLYRDSGPREPWYPRGTPMRNERQLSILSVEEAATFMFCHGAVTGPMHMISASASSQRGRMVRCTFGRAKRYDYKLGLRRRDQPATSCTGALAR